MYYLSCKHTLKEVLNTLSIKKKKTDYALNAKKAER